MKFVVLLLAAAPLFAGQREVLSGQFETVTGESYDFLFRYGSDRTPAAALLSDLTDPGSLSTFPRARMEVERDVAVTVSGAVERVPVWPQGTDRAVALRLLPSELVASGGVPLSPERWAGASTSIHPTLHANQPFEVHGPSDFDGDGIDDARDLFPADPDEAFDNDNDGIGNNADTDDDNDGMTDIYENAQQLNSLLDDAQDDPDSDGFTNLEEFAAGTGAQDGASSFHIESVGRPAPDKITLTWQARPGRRYEVWQRPQLDPRGVRVAENLTVREPEPLTVTLNDRGQRNFYYILAIADPP
jgi:hypothetical protein